MELKKIPNDTLTTALKVLRLKENSAQAEIVRYLAEVEERKLYLQLGFPTLFSFCIKALGYSPGSAHTRVLAARCFKDHPEVFELIRDGKISVCAVAEIAKIKVQSVKSEIIQEVIERNSEEEALCPSISSSQMSGELAWAIIKRISKMPLAKCAA